MEYRNLGRSDLKVSIVGLGCNNLGRSVDAKATANIVAKCVELGVNFFDCADVYGGRGKAEELLGAAAKAHPRDKLVIATKIGGGMHDGVHREGASRKYVIPAVEDCLRRLGLETIDLLQIHFPDPKTPIDETLGALNELVKSGKVRHVGCCNFSAAGVEEAGQVAKANTLTPFISAQNRHNVLEARIPKELAQACEKNGLGFLPFYPLAAGLLTGKYKAGEPPPPGTRLSVPNQFYDGLLNDTNFARLAKLDKFAKERNRSILELGIGWLASQNIVGSVICGATKPEQVESNVKASTWRLTADEMTQIDALVGAF